jgi:hypothetical protein
MLGLHCRGDKRRLNFSFATRRTRRLRKGRQDALAAGVFEGEVVRRHDRIELLADALNLRLASLSFPEVTGLLPN